MAEDPHTPVEIPMPEALRKQLDAFRRKLWRTKMAEAVLAGNSAFTYVSVLDCEISSLDQNDEFLAAYADEREQAWTGLEWQVAHAAGAWVGAYNAAFEHLKGGPGPVTEGLHDQARERLRRAGA
jgi:hypothetical protein